MNSEANKSEPNSEEAKVLTDEELEGISGGEVGAEGGAQRIEVVLGSGDSGLFDTHVQGKRS